jgi:hypothetical protein
VTALHHAADSPLAGVLHTCKISRILQHEDATSMSLLELLANSVDASSFWFKQVVWAVGDRLDRWMTKRLDRSLSRSASGLEDPRALQMVAKRQSLNEMSDTQRRMYLLQYMKATKNAFLLQERSLKDTPRSIDQCLTTWRLTHGPKWPCAHLPIGLGAVKPVGPWRVFLTISPAGPWAHGPKSS